MNTLYYGDNLNILRRYIKDESVDLIYLDPPFNSNRNYNVLFKDESGAEADSQIMAFEDTWHWAGAARTYNELILEGDKVAEMLQAFYSFIGTNQMMAHLVMMAVRLKELHRVLKPTGMTQLSIALLKNRLEGNFGLLPAKPGTQTTKPGTQAPSPASVRPDADERGTRSTSQMPGTVTPEEPALQAGAPAFPAYQVIGEPEDLRDAKQLATENRYQFQYWALSLIQARPLGGQTDGRTGKKGSDKGIDGIKVFTDDNSGKAKRVIVQVKSGGVKSGDIRDLVGTIDREGAAIGVFLTLEPATSHMLNEAASAGFFHSDGWNKDYPRIQVLTIEELLAGKQVDMPPSGTPFKQAERVSSDSTDQRALEFD